MTSGSLPYRGAAPRPSLNRLPGVRPGSDPDLTPGSDPGLTPVDRGQRGALPAWVAAAWLLSSAAGAAAAGLVPPAAGPDAKMAPAPSAATQSGTAFTKEA